MEALRIDRRAFLRISALAGGGFLIGLHLEPGSITQDYPGQALLPSTFVRIAGDLEAAKQWIMR